MREIKGWLENRKKIKSLGKRECVSWGFPEK